MKRELWLRLKHYNFQHLVPTHLVDHVLAMFGGPDAATKAFADKLSRKLGWTTEFALRAIEEYRKFLYLGSVSDFQVTPSKVIDQVWHEHLLFSRPYREFCRDVLRRDFEHHPELVSVGEQTDVFREQYQDTLDLYESEFRTAPPEDIWGTPKFPPGAARRARALRESAGSHAASGDGGTPLYLQFDGSASSGYASFESMPEFGGGGGFSGGGAGTSWSISAAPDATNAHAGGAGDASAAAVTGSDSSSGSDGGSSDGGSGGSGCSSSCGGGGCGGGGCGGS